MAAAETSARAGIDAVQIRERGLEDAELLTLVTGVTRRIAGTTARVLVNDRLDVAMMAGAWGVHLPANALPCARARTIVPESFVIGRSVHSVEEARAEAADGACDYLLFGTVFASRSKPVGHSGCGPRRPQNDLRRSADPGRRHRRHDRRHVPALWQTQAPPAWLG